MRLGSVKIRVRVRARITVKVRVRVGVRARGVPVRRHRGWTLLALLVANLCEAGQFDLRQ